MEKCMLTEIPFGNGVLNRCVVWTGDEKVFFFNPTTRLSMWERPEELKDRADVDRILAEPPHKKKREAGSSLSINVLFLSWVHCSLYANATAVYVALLWSRTLDFPKIGTRSEFNLSTEVHKYFKLLSRCSVVCGKNEAKH